MRIALSNSSTKWGGVHVVTELLAANLQARGHEVVVFGYPDSQLQERMQGVAPFEPIGRGMDLSPLAIGRAMASMKRHRTQVVLAMMKKDVRHTVPAAWALGIPSVVRYANDRPLDSGLYDRIFFGQMPVRHITNSDATRRTLLRSAPWISPDDMEVVHNGIDPAPFDSADKANFGLPVNSLAIGFVGRLEKRKGLLELATAWTSIASQLPHGHLLIAGIGPDEAAARSLLGNTPRVHWLGFRSDIPSVFRSLDIVAIPSHWEGFGLVAGEALLAGAAVVATNTSSLPEIVTDGIHGLLIPPHDPESLGISILRLARDTGLRKRMTASGRARVLAEFSPATMVAQYEQVLAEAIRAAGRPPIPSWSKKLA